jgi:hypothetical protein
MHRSKQNLYFDHLVGSPGCEAKYAAMLGHVLVAVAGFYS